MSDTSSPSAPLAAVRFKLAADEAAPQPDPLSRARIGYAPDLSARELWERGRGVWKAKLTAVADCELVILAHNGVVVQVGTVDGVNFAGDRIAVTGTPDPSHPLIGQPDPLDNASRNPVAYGEVRTVRPTVGTRPYGVVLADAIAVITEAARLQRPGLRQTDDGKWQRDPHRPEPEDWPEFVTLALAGAAANIGSVYGVLAGRPGSWEAAGIEQLLDSTVGDDGHDLWRHRTEPVRITAAAGAVIDRFSIEPGEWVAEDELDREEDAEREAHPLDWDAVEWSYTVPEEGDPLPQSPDAPAWSWDTLREQLTSYEGMSARDAEDYITRIQKRQSVHGHIATTLVLSKDAAAEARIVEHNRVQDEITQRYEERRELLKAQQLQERTAYAAELTARLERAVAALPGLAVPVEISIDPTSEEHEIIHEKHPYSLEWTLLEEAAESMNTGSSRP